MTRASSIAGAGCGLLALLSLCFVTGVVPYLRAGAARDAAHGFLEDLRGGAWQQALQRMGPGYQAAHDATRLANEVGRLPALHTHHGATFYSHDIDEGSITLDGLLHGDDGDTPVSVSLSQSGEYWYVDLLAVAGQPLR